MIILPKILSSLCSLIIDETRIPRGWGEGRPISDPGLGARSREAVATRKLGGCEASCERRRDACSTHQCFKCIQFKVCQWNCPVAIPFRNQILKLICHDMSVWSYRVRCAVKMKWTSNIKQWSFITPCIFWTFKQKGPSLLRKVKLHMEPWQHWLWKKDQWELCHNLIQQILVHLTM